MFYSVLVTITLRLLNAECLQGLQGVDIVDVDEFTQLCISLLISLPHLPTGFNLRQVPRKVRYRLLSCPLWVVLYRIYDPDRID